MPVVVGIVGIIGATTVEVKIGVGVTGFEAGASINAIHPIQ